MNKIIIIGIISFATLVGCSAVESTAQPTVTVTQLPPESVPQEYISSEDRFVNFVRSNGGLYGEAAETSDIISIGNTICDAYSTGMTENEIITALAESLIESNMNDEDGHKFAAALLFGAEKYLCNGSI